MILPGTYANGFAPRDGRPLYPELWRGCVGAWNPGLGVSGLTLRDWSGFQNNGTLTNGPTWAASQGKYVLNFDGVDDYVQIAGSRIYAQTGTAFGVHVSAVVNNFTNPYVKLVMLRSNSASAYEIGVSNQSAYLGVLIGANSTWARVKSGTASADISGKQISVSVSYSGADSTLRSSFQIWFNGVEAVTTDAQAFSATTNSTTIAYNIANNRLDGNVCDVMTYNRPLTNRDAVLFARRIGIAYEMAPRRRSSAAVPVTSYSTFRPSVLRGSR